MLASWSRPVSEILPLHVRASQAQEEDLTCQMLCAKHCHPMITVGKEKVFAGIELDANFAAATCRFSNLLRRSSAS